MATKRLSGFIILAGVLAAFPCAAYEPILSAPAKIQAGGSDLDIGSFAIPRVCDWNNDGRKDLVIGQAESGTVRLYLNSGTDAAPVFTSFSYLQADGADISVTSIGCQGAAPEVIDWNTDGRKDLLVGDGAGYTTLFVNVGTDAAPVLTEVGMIEVGGATFTVGGRANPCVNDWNEDGKKDLLIGRYDGTISLLINTNTDADPVFDAADLVDAGPSPLDVGGRSSPRVFDWDGDGLKDLLVGEADGRLFFYANTGTNAAPDFGAGVFLQAGGAQFTVWYRSRPHVVDWNNDGLPDVLCGSYDGCVYLPEQTFIFEIETIAYDAGAGTTLVWRSRLGDTYAVYTSTDLAGWSLADGSVPSDGYTTEWTDAASPAFTRRFYRIALPD